MKKIAALLITFVMLGQTVFASVYDEWLYGTDDASQNVSTSQNSLYSDAVDTLEGLGLLDNLYFKLTEGATITRGNFLGLVMHIDNLGVMGELPEDEKFSDVPLAEGYAYGVYEALRRGIIDGTGDNTFHPDEPLSYAAAQKILVNVLGYKLMAESKGGYPAGYTSLSASLDLIIKPENQNALNSEEAAAMIVSALLAKYRDASFDNVLNGNAENEDKTWLEEKYDILKYKGIVDATEQSSLYDITGTGKNAVSINDSLYETEFDFTDFLGKSVYYFVKDEDTVIYAFETNKNEVLVIDAEDISGISDRKIEYYEGSKLKSAEILKTASVIYNNICLPNYKMEDMKIDNGKLELISNTGSKEYNIVKISEYTPVIVNATDVDAEVIYATMRDYNLKTPKAKSITFDIKEYDLFELYNPAGEKEELKNLTEGTVLNMLIAKNKKCVKAYIGGSKSEGLVEEITDDGKPAVVIAANKMELSPVSMIGIEDFLTGTNVCVYTDMFGKIIYAKKTVLQETEYGYLISVFIADDNETGFVFKIYDREGVLKKIPSAEKFYLNDTKISDYSKIPDEIKESGAVLYRLNEYGEVQKIYTPDADNSPLKSICSENSEKLLYTGGNNYKFATSSGFDPTAFCVDENTVMLSVPSDAKSADEKYFSVLELTKFVQFESHTVKAYTQNENSNTAEFVLSHIAQGALSTSKDAAVITDIKTGINSNDEVVSVLTMTGYSFKNKQFTTTSKDVILNIPFASNDKDMTVTNAEVGDLVVYASNNMGEIQEVTVVAKAVSPGEETKYWTKAAYNGVWYSNLAIYRGYLNNVKNKIGEFCLHEDADKKFTFKLHDSLVILRVDKDAQRTADRVEFMDASKIASFENSGQIQDSLLYVKTGTPRILIIYK